jgi:hypothetical protein
VVICSPSARWERPCLAGRALLEASAEISPQPIDLFTLVG